MYSQCMQESCKKRKMDNGIDMKSPSYEDFVKAGRTFLPISADSGIYQTDEWKSSGTAMFHPVLQDQYINIKKLDKISAGQGSFFIADQSGNYFKNITGNVLHMWRYDKQERKMFISQSFLFTNSQAKCIAALDPYFHVCVWCGANRKEVTCIKCGTVKSFIHQPCKRRQFIGITLIELHL